MKTCAELGQEYLDTAEKIKKHLEAAKADPVRILAESVPSAYVILPKCIGNAALWVTIFCGAETIKTREVLWR